MQLMVAATLILLCSRPLNVNMFGEVPWLLTIPSIAIIGREVGNSFLSEKFIVIYLHAFFVIIIFFSFFVGGVGILIEKN